MSPTSPEQPKRVLLGAPEPRKFEEMTQALKALTIEVESAPSVLVLLKRIEEEAFALCVIHSPADHAQGAELVTLARKKSRHPAVKILVISPNSERENIMSLIRAGANDFVAEPYDPTSLHERLLYHFAPKETIDPKSLESAQISGECSDYFDQMVKACELLSGAERGEEHGAIHVILKNLAQKTQSNRANLVCFDDSCHVGVVVASSDDPRFHDFPLDLSKYPEILHVMHTGNFVLIDDVSRNGLTRKISDNVRSIQIGSIMVFPVRFHGRIRGVLTIRRPKASALPSAGELRALQALANMMAAHSAMNTILRRIYGGQPKTPPEKKRA